MSNLDIKGIILQKYYNYSSYSAQLYSYNVWEPKFILSIYSPLSPHSRSRPHDSNQLM